MLPAPQMHPSMMPGRQTHDSLSSVFSREESEDVNGFSRRNNLTLRRSFPIRISHSNQQAAIPVAHHITLSEQNLRRKTPSGTVDAGYDGSHAQPSPGPPLKHMILPITSETKPFLDSSSIPARLHHWIHPALPDPYEHDIRSQAGYMPTSHAYNDMAGSLQYIPDINLIFNTSFPATVQPPHLSLPVMRPNERKVEAFCPPPMPINGSHFFGQAACQLGSSPWDYHNHDRTCHFQGSHPSQPGNKLTYGTTPGERSIHQNLIYFGNNTSHMLPNQTSNNIPRNEPFHGLCSGLSAETMTPNDQSHFCVKTLQYAYQSYIDLLSYLQASGKTNPMRTKFGSFDTQKLPAYPKPPKLWCNARSEDISHLDSIESQLNKTIGTLTPHNRRRTLESNHAPFGAMSCGQEEHRCSSYSDNRLPQTGSDSIPCSLRHLNYAKPLPIANALSSIEALTSLCEQSSWKWIDGMLLGGCIHYSLEQYNEALRWFSNVVSVDSSHVEAITHMGAALYCLGRQHEAEQNWLRAVKLRPTYLDATEHLVGHLYRNRSAEAVEVISYVQKSAYRVIPDSRSDFNLGVIHDLSDKESFCISNKLNLDSSTLDGGMVVDATGFGSSGYQLPGMDNGRMLALIHAKGTMLYGQKDIERASEAFQEAVLISVGRQVSGIQELIHRIRTALAPQSHHQMPERSMARSLQPLMLPPEKARYTARLVFGSNGELPGLVYLRNELSKRAAIQTTSNSLLSLAKILQDAMSSASVDSSLHKGTSQVGDILALYYLSLSLQESPSTANNVGILLAGIQQTNASISTTNSALTSPYTGFPGIIPGTGLALALAYYNYGLRLDPNHVHLHTNFGSLLKDIGQLDLAIQMYERAVSCDGTFDIALTNLANAVKDKGRIDEAIVYYRRAMNANPGFAEAVCGLFTALNSICNWHGRGGVLLESGQLDRWHVDGDGRLVDGRTNGCSNGLTKQVVGIVTQQIKYASQWGMGMLQEPMIHRLTSQLQHLCQSASFRLDDALRRWAGQPWEGSRILRLIERATKIIQRRWYLDSRQGAAKGYSRYSRPKLPQNLMVPSAPTVLPFHTFTCPLSAIDIRTIAQRNALRISCSTLRSPWISATVCQPPPPPNPQLNVGYLSSDFNNHPLAHLMQSVFGFHNPHRIHAICYATTPSDGSIHRQQIENQAPIFRDVSIWPPDRLIEQIALDNIHILVNLNGYTRGARNEIFAARPAPIQMSFMGFAGTLGAEWCDYLLADETAIPPSTLRPWRHNNSIEDVFRDDNEGFNGDWMYSENIVFCRETFFCCDHAQSCASSEVSTQWAEVERHRWEMRRELFPSLGDDVIILGNFNQLYKIDPTTFRSWLRILAEAPRTVLWLLRFPEPGEGNLKATARLWAGPEVASRIVFTDVAPKNQHISRARVCDLFLDTPECNAHTTAADVLWSSTPLLTFPRYSYKMCSRIAASILRGALPRSTEGKQVAVELIVDSEEEYERRAVELANGLTYTLNVAGYGQGQGRLADMRKLLWDSKWHCSLFNTRRWVEDLEAAYEEAWERWVSGIGGDIHL